MPTNSARELDPARLEPCPFCRHNGEGINHALDDSSGRWCVACLACGTHGPSAHSFAEATAAWNRRFQSGPERAAEEMLTALTRLLAVEALEVPADDWEQRNRDWNNALREARAAIAAAQEQKPCDLGVGCEQAGVCYAAAHGEPERCGRIPAPKPPVQP